MKLRIFIILSSWFYLILLCGHILGNGTIGLEILDDLYDVDSVVVPFGGGGLSSGIALAVKGRNPNVKVWSL